MSTSSGTSKQLRFIPVTLNPPDANTGQSDSKRSMINMTDNMMIEDFKNPHSYSNTTDNGTSIHQQQPDPNNDHTRPFLSVISPTTTTSAFDTTRIKKMY